MIGISFNKKEFEYDAYTLVKAFYPKEEVEMYCTLEEEAPREYEKLVSIFYGDQVRIRPKKQKKHFKADPLQAAGTGDRPYPSLGKSYRHPPC